jgi:streptogramin lyase
MIAAAAAACSGGNPGTDSTQTAMHASLQGSVHGGQAPISGSAVTLYAASRQPLSPAATVATGTTDSNGNFTFTSFTCPSPTAEMYITSLGGNPGGGANSAIHLMTILGQCQNLPRSVVVNELTTVAAAYTANQFIGPSGCVDCGSAPPGAVDNISGSALGLTNAMENAALLVGANNGADAASLPTSAECPSSGPAPTNCATLRKVNYLANALASCVNSSGPSSAQCTELLNCSVPHAVYASNNCTPPGGAVVPVDTLQAILSIARNPATVSPSGIYNSASQNVVFNPSVAGSYSDLTVSLSIIGNEFGQLQDLAIDAGGNIWVSNYGDAGTVGDGGTVVKLGPNGSFLGKFSSNSAGGTYAYGLAVDGANNVWVSNFTNTTNSLTELNQAGSPINSTPLANGSGGLVTPLGVAVSPLSYPNGNVWVVDGNGPLSSQPGYLSEFNYVASPYGSGYNLGTTNQYPVRDAVDTNGYVWVTDNNNNTIQQVSPTGAVLNNLTAGSINSPYGIAVDPNNNIWITNAPSGGPHSLTKYNVANETFVSASNYTGGGLNVPEALAIDSAGNVWVANYNSSTISEFSASGVPITPSTGYSGAGPFNPTGIGVDPSGNVWLSNYSGTHPGVTVFFGVAAPTVTPKVTALANGFVP